MWRSLGWILVLGGAAGGAAVAALHAGAFIGAGEAVFAAYREAGIDLSEGIFISELHVIAAIGAACFMAWAALEVPRLWQAAVVFAGALALTFTLSLVLALYGVLFEPFSAAAALAASFAAAALVSSTTGSRRRRRAARLVGNAVEGKAFAQAAASAAVADPVRREVSVVTCRILNAGELVASLAPDDVVALHSQFLGGIRRALLEAGAFIDESSPDGVRGVFGAFAAEGDRSAAGEACQTALAVRAEARRLAESCEQRWGDTVRFGVSVTTGPAAAGPMDGALRIVSSAVDFGRRLSVANAIYGSRVLVDARTAHLTADEMAVRPMEMLFDPHTAALAEIYELLGLTADLAPEELVRRDTFWEGVIHFRKGKLKDARAAFERALTDEVRDYPLEYFLARVRGRGVGEQPGGAPASNGSPRHARSADTL